MINNYQKEKEDRYTSTGGKLLHHPDALKWLKSKIGRPISLQISPTSKCNLNCVFCSNVNRSKDEALEVHTIYNLLEDMRNLGAKTVEWTGGGDPTLYSEINKVIRYAHTIGYLQGFITNGILLAEKVGQKNLDFLHWVRISMNCLDYIKEIKMPNYGGTLGFSYVMNAETTPIVLENLNRYVRQYSPAYVRIVPNCQTTQEEQESSNRILSEIVADWGHPYFYQAKKFARPKNCWWCYIKPFINHDGYVYPCSSIVLNLDADKQFHEKYRWCKIEELKAKYSSSMVPFDPKDCSHCVFKSQNDLIESIINPSGMEDFV